MAPYKLRGASAVLSLETAWNKAKFPGIQTEEQMGRNLFVVSRRYPDLYEYLRERFASDSAVEVILDRRIAQRRQSNQAASAERRRADRRRRPEVETELETRSHAIITIPDSIDQ